MNLDQFRTAALCALVAASLSACAGAGAEAPPEETPTPTASSAAASPTPTVVAKPETELPEVPIIASITSRATDVATGAALNVSLVAHLPQDLGTPAADQIIEVLSEAGDTSLLSIPGWRSDNQVKFMILDLTTTQVGDIEWPADALIGVELGPWVQKEARAPLGVELATKDGRFGYATYVSGVVDAHVIAAYVYGPEIPLVAWFDYQSSLAITGSLATELSDCVYAPTALAEPWQANPSWYEYGDPGFLCGAGFAGE